MVDLCTPPLPPHPCLCWDLVPSLSLNNCNYIYCRLGGKVLHVFYRYQNISQFTFHSLSFLRFSQFSPCTARRTLIYSVYSSFVSSSYSMETLLSTDALSCLNSSTHQRPHVYHHHPLYQHHPPSPSLLAAPPGRLIDSLPGGGGGSCHISNLASPPPDKSCIHPFF